MEDASEEKGGWNAGRVRRENTPAAWCMVVRARGHSTTRTERSRGPHRNVSQAYAKRDLDVIFDMGQRTGRCVPVVVYR